MDSGCWVQDFSSGRLQDAQPLFQSIPLPKHKLLSLQHRQRGIIVLKARFGQQKIQIIAVLKCEFIHLNVDGPQTEFDQGEVIE